METIMVCVAWDDREREYPLVWSADGTDEAYYRDGATAAIACRIGMIARKGGEYNPVALACYDPDCDHESPGECVFAAWYSVQSFDADDPLPDDIRAGLVIL